MSNDVRTYNDAEDITATRTSDDTATETPITPETQPTVESDLTPGRYIKVRWVKSGIGYSARQRATIASLGLRKLGQERIHKATDSILGMCNAISHLVVVEEVQN